jgi:ApaG protein
MARPEFTCSVTVRHLPEESNPDAHLWAYAYTVKITNTGDVAAQLIARHWLITDSHGQVEEVRGLAVVGHQPLLGPGQSFEYTSWTRLHTPRGSMRGTYFCMTENAEAFEAPIPEFGLNQPSALH